MRKHIGGFIKGQASVLALCVLSHGGGVPA
jgi:hypothetical protein